MITATVIGRLTKDPVFNVYNGRDCLKFSVASDNRKKKDSEVTTTYINCTMWGQMATSFQNYLSKGKLVFVSGELELETWERDGGGGKNLELNVSSINPFLIPTNNSNGEGSNTSSSSSNYSGGNNAANVNRLLNGSSQPNKVFGNTKIKPPNSEKVVNPSSMQGKPAKITPLLSTDVPNYDPSDDEVLSNLKI